MTQFLIFASPEAWLGPAPGVLRGPIDPFAEHADRVLHPGSPLHRCFRFEFRDGQILVPSAAASDWFDSPEKDNLLLLDAPPQADVLCLRPESAPLWYVRLSLTDHPLASIPAGHSDRLYVQVGYPPAGHQAAAVSITCAEDCSPACWVNPVVLQFPLAGDALDARSLRESPFSRLSPDTSLGVVPLFDDETARHIRGLTWLIDALPRSEHPTIFEALLRGGREAAVPGVPAPFAMLDQLGGQFLIEGPGKVAAASAWSPPASASANLLWFARHWQARWGGEWRDCCPLGAAIAPEAVADVPRQRRLCSVQASRPATLMSQILTELSRSLPAGNPISVMRTFVRFHRRDPVSVPSEWCERLCVAADGTERYSVDAVGLVDQLARRLLLPRSEIRVRFSAEPVFRGGTLRDQIRAGEEYRNALAKAWVDLLRSFRLGGWEFLTRLFRGFDPHVGTRLDWRYGWWNEWYDRLFVSAADARWQFRIAPRGFSLGKSRLGSTAWDTPVDDFRQSPEIKM